MEVLCRLGKRIPPLQIAASSGKAGATAAGFLHVLTPFPNAVLLISSAQPKPGEGTSGAGATAGASAAPDGAGGGGGGKGLKAVLNNLEELWDDAQYKEEYNLDSFLARMKSQ